MKKIIYLFLLAILMFGFNSCDDKVDGGTNDINFISFESSSFSFGVDLGGTTIRDINVYTTQTTGSDRTFSVNVNVEASTADAASYAVPATVLVPANTNVGVLSVSVTDLNIDPDDGETLVLEFTNTDGLFSGNAITLNISQVCPYNEVMLSITFDSWPEESYWELLDSNDNVLFSAAEGDYAGEDSFAKTFCLQNGTYTFTIYDAYADGTGDYSLNYNGTTLASGGAFGASDTTTFTVNM